MCCINIVFQYGPIQYRFVPVQNYGRRHKRLSVVINTCMCIHQCIICLLVRVDSVTDFATAQMSSMGAVSPPADLTAAATLPAFNQY